MIKLYFAPRTRSVRILWLPEELGLPYEMAFALVIARVLGIFDDCDPALNGYLASLQARPAFQKALAA